MSRCANIELAVAVGADKECIFRSCNQDLLSSIIRRAYKGNIENIRIFIKASRKSKIYQAFLRNKLRSSELTL